MSLLKVLELSSRGYRVHEIYPDVLEMVVCALSQQQMEERYLEISSKYEKRDLLDMQNFIPELVKQYENSEDPLGDVYMEISNGKLGQFFTPFHVCKLLSEITFNADDVHLGSKINDCAVGSGRTLLAIHHSLPNHKKSWPIYVGQDLDKICVHMTTINMCLNGMFGYIIHGNTLTLDIFGGYHIKLRNGIPCVYVLSADEASKVIIDEKTSISN